MLIVILHRFLNRSFLRIRLLSTSTRDASCRPCTRHIFGHLLFQDRLILLKCNLLLEHRVLELILVVWISFYDLYMLLNAGELQQGVDADSFVDIYRQQHLNQVRHVRREALRQRRVFALNDLNGESCDVRSIEGWAECAHLIQDHAKRPQISLVIVLLGLDNLRR